MYDIRARWQFRNFSKFPNFFPVRLRGGPRHARAEGDRSGELTAMAPPKLKRCLRLVVVFGASSVVAVESPRVPPRRGVPGGEERSATGVYDLPCTPIGVPRV